MYTQREGNEKMKKILSAILIICIIASFVTVAYASLKDVKVQISYRDIKIIKNGREIPTEFEPFIYNGHTYIAIRDIANIFGLPVSYDSKDNAIILGSKEKKWVALSELSFLKEKLEEQEDGSFINVGSSYNEILSGIRFATIKGQVYRDTLLFGGSGTEYFKYNLNGKYDSIRFLLAATDDSFVSSNKDDYAIVKIYGDKKLLYTSPKLRPDMEAVLMKIPLKGVNTLTIEKILNGDSIIKVGFANAQLKISKK